MKKKQILAFIIIFTLIMPSIVLFPLKVEASNIYTFNTSTNWTVPATATYIIEAWGASGKDGGWRIGSPANRVIPGGKGAYVRGEITLNKNELLQINTGGTNGAAADIRKDGTSLMHRIIVAGGGGSTPYIDNNNTPGYHNVYAGNSSGSGYTGDIAGRERTIVTAGTQTAGGKGGTGTISGEDGTFGFGGAGAYEAKGGDGWYGGGGGCRMIADYAGNTYWYLFGGAGGSSYIGGVANGTIMDGVNVGASKIIITRKNNAPTINITTPADNAIIHKGNVNIQLGAFDPDGDDLIYSIKIGTTPGGTDIFSGTPNGTKTNTSAIHNLNTSSISATLNWNESTNRYERRIYVEATVSDSIVTDTKSMSFLLINYKPNITVDTPVTAHTVNNNEPFSLTGKAWDVNSDRLTIQATIDGKTVSTNINTSPTSQPASNNWTLTWSGANAIKEGSYSNITITVTDAHGGTNQVIWNGNITIKDILKIINDRIKENIGPVKDNDIRIVLGNTDVGISQSDQNDSYINNIKNSLSNIDAGIFFIGKDGGTKEYITTKLTPDYGLSANDNTENILEYVLQKNRELQKSEIPVFIVGDLLENEILFEDAEKDYQNISLQDKLKKNTEVEKELKLPKTGSLKISYEHDPSIFDNPVSKHYKGDENWHSIEDMKDPFVIERVEASMRGLWTISIIGSDNTKNAPFDKESDKDVVNVIFHQKPVAIMKYYPDTNYIYVTGEDSYDIDYMYQLERKGIIKYRWDFQTEDGLWQKLGSEDYKVAIPRIYGGKNVIKYHLTVTDFHGATDTTKDADVITPELRAKVFPELSKFNLLSPGIPASEEIKAVDIETIPYAFDTVEFALYEGAIRKTPLTTLNYPSDLKHQEILSVHYKDIRNYKIPETLPDKNYIAKVRAIKGTEILERNFDIRVNTPIDLEPQTPTVIRTKNYTLDATTTKYANTCTVTAFKGTPYEAVVSLNSNQLGDIKQWKKDMIAPMSILNKTYEFEFRATTPNGNQEIKTRYITFYLYDITETVDVGGKRGEKLKTRITTTLGAEKVEIELPESYQRIIRLNEKDYTFGNPIKNAKLIESTAEHMIWEYEFILPWTQTAPADGEYTIPVKATFNGGTVIEKNFKCIVNDYLKYYNPSGVF